ncbi:hypothetical protein [Lichenicoccus sp.]|uniref:hypothetical protein n=1 Tax=Lichenicoccus sp. TaxID=2781899 RepID=UPI003D107B37
MTCAPKPTPLFDDPRFWRDQAYRHEAVGDISGAVLYWQAAITAARRQAAVAGTPSDLKWLHGRLARARSVEDLVTDRLVAKILN